MLHKLIVLTIILTCFVVEGYITCNSKILYTTTTCFGTGAYCCGLNNDECCWEKSVYTYWWFWFIWFWAVLMIVSCAICICIRRRRLHATRQRYIIVEPQTSYGTVPCGYNNPANSIPTAQTQHNYMQAPTNAVSVSTPSYQKKPPKYSTAAQN